MALLEVKGLSKQYSGFRLQDISLSLENGYILGYIGPNGAGKTTTLDLICGLRDPQAGEVLIDGLTYAEDPVRYREMIGYVGDNSYFPEDFDRRDIRGILTDFYPTFDPDRYDMLCDRWKLPPRENIKTYSRGMRVRLMFAAVLSRETKLLVLDEATNGLDPLMRREIIHMLQEYIADGAHSVIFSTHIMEDLDDIADYIFLIRDGEKILYDTRDELLERFVLVKGGLEQLTPQLRSRLTGIETSAYGFEALYDTEQAEGVPADLSAEKPTVDQLVLHMLGA